MVSFDNMSIEELLNPNGHVCGCGMHHTTGLKTVRIGRGVINETVSVLRELGCKKPFIVADANTWRAAGKQVSELFDKNGIAYSAFVFPASKGHIEPNEAAVGSILFAFDKSCDVIVAVGSGVINDCCRVIANVANIGHIVVGTAPSMDGYASNSSSMVVNNVKVTVPGRPPQAIIGDIDILKEAPMEMLLAGLGDVFAKYSAICEWRISALVNGDSYCENTARLVRACVRKVKDSAVGLAQRDPDAVKAVMEGLVLSGIGMDLVKNSRPASGLEHYFSHLWEMDSLQKGIAPHLHGICVGVGECLTLKLFDALRNEKPSREKAQAAYEAFDQTEWEKEMHEVFGSTAQTIIDSEKNIYRKNGCEKHNARLNAILSNWDEILKIIDEELPDTASITALMKKVGFPTLPCELGYSDSDVYRAYIGTREIRDKYLLSSLLWDLGLLKDAEYLKHINTSAGNDR